MRIVSPCFFLLSMFLFGWYSQLSAQVPFEPGDFTDRVSAIKSNHVVKRTGYLFPDSGLVNRIWLQNHIQMEDSLIYSETYYTEDGYRSKELTYGANGKPKTILSYSNRHQLCSKVVYVVNDTVLFGYVFLYRWKREECTGVDLFYGFTRDSELDSILNSKRIDSVWFSSHTYEHDETGNITKSLPSEGSGDTTSLFFHYDKFRELTGVYGNDINHWMISFEYSEDGSLKRYFGNGNPGVSYLDDFSFRYQNGLLASCEIAGTGIVKYYYTGK